MSAPSTPPTPPPAPPDPGGAEALRTAVFIQDFVDVDLPERLVSERLSEGQAWLARLASAAGGDAESRLVRLGPSSLGSLVARDVRVRLGRPTTSGRPQAHSPTPAAGPTSGRPTTPAAGPTSGRPTTPAAGLEPADGGVVVPLRWEDAKRPGFFPLLDGNLEVAPLGPEASRVVLYASYRPPFDGVGRVLDQALFHRVAESTVRSFLQKVAETLQEDLPRDPPPG